MMNPLFFLNDESTEFCRICLESFLINRHGQLRTCHKDKDEMRDNNVFSILESINGILLPKLF